jgi:uncharacterized protein (DUF2236 family)
MKSADSSTAAAGAARVVPGPEAVTWARPDSYYYRYGGLWAASLLVPYVTLLTTLHPTVGAGVNDHSVYLEDPVGRAQRTAAAMNAFVYGSPERVVQASRRLRERHTSITGRHPDGEPYFALDPEAYAFVHATGFILLRDVARWFARPLSGTQADEAYGEFLAQARVLGLRARDVPDDVDAFWDYVDDMCEHRLVAHPTARTFIDVVTSAPGWFGTGALPLAVRKALWWPKRQLARLLLFGAMPQVLRLRLDVGWSPADELQWRALAMSVQRTTAVLPDRVRLTPVAYRAIARARAAQAPAPGTAVAASEVNSPSGSSASIS